MDATRLTATVNVYARDVAEALVPIFRAADGPQRLRWYERLGFSVVGEHRFDDGLPLYLFLRRGDIYLHLRSTPATPGQARSSTSTSTTSIRSPTSSTSK